jgi:hypothetical protein
VANPDPKALRDAAASLRQQANAAREVSVAQYRQHGIDDGATYDRAKAQLDAANAEVKSHQDAVNTGHQQATTWYKAADDAHQQANAAAASGDQARAEELREKEMQTRAAADSAAANAGTAEQDLNQSKLTLAQRQNDFDVANQKIRDVMVQRSATEKQLDAMENKARALDDAGLKLQYAATLDNPVERADAELAAEKLIRDANGIAVDTAAITAATGQPVQIPDVSAMPPAADPTATDATATGATSGDGGDGSAAAPGSATTPDPGATPDAGATSDATAPGHLQDDFATVAAGDDGAAATDAASPDPTAAGAPNAAGAPDDALGAASDVAASDAPDVAASDVAAPDVAATPDPSAAPDLTAAPDPLGVDAPAPAVADADATAAFDASAPAPGTTGDASGDASGDGSGFDTPSDGGADQTVAAADPMPDASAGSADSFNDFSADPSANDAAVSVGDDADS